MPASICTRGTEVFVGHSQVVSNTMQIKCNLSQQSEIAYPADDAGSHPTRMRAQSELQRRVI